MSTAASKDLCGRLRIVAGQSVVRPPAIDMEAADHIEGLEREIARLKRDQKVVWGDVEWLNAQAVSNLPLVDEAIRGLLEDHTGDNATCMVREVMRAAMSATWHLAADLPSDYRQVVVSLKPKRWNSKPVYMVARYFRTQPGIHDGEPGWCDNEGYDIDVVAWSEIPGAPDVIATPFKRKEKK